MIWWRTRLPFGVAVAVLLVLGMIGLSNTASAAEKTTARLWWVDTEFDDTANGCRADPSFGTTDGEFSASISAASGTRELDEAQLNLDDGTRVQVVANGRKTDGCGYKLRFRVTDAKNYRLHIGSFGVDIPKARLVADLPAVVVNDSLSSRSTKVKPAPVQRTSAEVALPVSDDPQTLVDQIYANYTSALATNDPDFLDYIFVDRNSELGVRFIAEMASVEQYRDLRDDRYKKVASGRVISSDFTNPHERVAVVDSTVRTSGRRLEKSERLSRSTLRLTLRQKQVPADLDGDGLQQATIWVISYSDNIDNDPDGLDKPASLTFEVGGFRYEARMTGVEFGADFPGDLPIRPGREGYRVSLAVTNLQTDRIAGRPFEFQLYARISAVAPADCELVRTHDVTGPDGATYCELRDTEISDGLASGEVFSARQTVTWVLGNRPGNSIPEGSLRPADLLVLAHIGNVIPDQQLGFLPQLAR